MVQDLYMKRYGIYNVTHYFGQHEPFYDSNELFLLMKNFGVLNDFDEVKLL